LGRWAGLRLWLALECVCFGRCSSTSSPRRASLMAAMCPTHSLASVTRLELIILVCNVLPFIILCYSCCA
jgi:hypothetical protein